MRANQQLWKRPANKEQKGFRVKLQLSRYYGQAGSRLQPVMLRHCKWRHARSLYPRLSQEIAIYATTSRRSLLYKGMQLAESRVVLWWNDSHTPQRSWATATGEEEELEEEEVEKRKMTWTLSTWCRIVSTVWCTLRTFFLWVLFTGSFLCITPALFFYCITVYKPPPPCLHRQHYYAVWCS